MIKNISKTFQGHIHCIVKQIVRVKNGQSKTDMKSLLLNFTGTFFYMLF